MRVLLDENIDRLLKPLFPADLVIATVRERGWQGRSNGELLRAAQSEFDALVTMDTSLEHQQNLSQFKLAVLVVRARSNAYSDIAPLVPRIAEALRTVEPGTVVHISA